jgi:predicted DNA-binding transcriptional regulator AlpA
MTLNELEQRLRAGGHLVSLGRATDVKGAAAVCGIKPRTLYAWHALGEGPPRRQIGPGRVLYQLEELLGWLEAREHIKSDCVSLHSAADHCKRRIP